MFVPLSKKDSRRRTESLISFLTIVLVLFPGSLRHDSLYESLIYCEKTAWRKITKYFKWPKFLLYLHFLTLGKKQEARLGDRKHDDGGAVVVVCLVHGGPHLPRPDSLAPFFSLSGICVQHIRCWAIKMTHSILEVIPFLRLVRVVVDRGPIPKSSVGSVCARSRESLKTKPNRANTLWYFTFLFLTKSSPFAGAQWRVKT